MPDSAARRQRAVLSSVPINWRRIRPGLSIVRFPSSRQPKDIDDPPKDGQHKTDVKKCSRLSALPRLDVSRRAFL